MINQVRADLEAHRWTRFVLAGILVLGIVTWGHVVATRAGTPRTSSHRSQVSVLPDPFVDQSK